MIKGTASALYGSSALGGVVNLVSRKPGNEPLREVLLNQTSRGGTDAVAFMGHRFGPDSTPWGGTLLVSGHRQRANDLDSDGWADMAGYDRLVARPRLFYDRDGRSIFATLGFTGEDRDGGTLRGASVKLLKILGQPVPGTSGLALVDREPIGHGPECTRH